MSLKLAWGTHQEPISKKKKGSSSAVDHSCYPSYSSSSDQEDHSSSQLGVLADACHPSYTESVNRMIIVQVCLAKT
jgi:hypothetical protein